MRVGLSRQRIIEAAAILADQEGLENVTLTAVAAKLGVRKPSLYNHVAGLPELRQELSIFAMQELQGRISASAIGRAKADAVWAIARAYRKFAHNRPGLYRAVVMPAGSEHPAVKQAIQQLMQVMETVLAAYSLPEEERIHALRGFRSVMHGFVALEAAGWFIQPVEKEASYRQLIHTFIRGLKG